MYNLLLLIAYLYITSNLFYFYQVICLRLRIIQLQLVWNIIEMACFVQVNKLRPKQNGRQFADDTFKCISLNENVRISIKISLNVVPYGPINNILALVHIMAWRRSGDKPLSETMLVRLPTHICATWPQWVKVHRIGANFTQKTSYEMLIKWKSSSICEWEAISTFLSKEIRFPCFVYYLDTDNLERLADHNLFN